MTKVIEGNIDWFFGRRGTSETCLHKGCPQCHGTGVKDDGTPCIHMISCNCPRCSPRC